MKVLNLVLPNVSLGRIDSSTLSRNKTEVSLSEGLGQPGLVGGRAAAPGGNAGVYHYPAEALCEVTGT